MCRSELLSGVSRWQLFAVRSGTVSQVKSRHLAGRVESAHKAECGVMLRLSPIMKNRIDREKVHYTSGYDKEMPCEMCPLNSLHGIKCRSN